MTRSQGVIRIDYPTGEIGWKVSLLHSGQFPLEKGSRTSAIVLKADPPLDETAFGHRPLWAFLESDPQHYQFQFERDGTCRVALATALKISARDMIRLTA